MSDWTRDEMMTIAAARLLWDGCVCFVGIGLPSAACNLARLTHAPGIVLIYESGTLGTRPDVLPLSIGDGELAETAACVIPLPEVFAYLLQAGRVDVGFLGAAQLDRYGNLNSTVIGPYEAPSTRLPGAGGATEIAAHARRTFVMLKATPRSLVARLDFRTSAGFLDGRGARTRTTMRGGGPQAVITDFGLLTPAPDTDELQLTALYPGTTIDDARTATGWPLAVAATVETLAPPTAAELDTLRALQARTREAHRRPVRLPA
ncbi:MAG: acyl CoA:acetate/3-ketoacid CoA transferase, beta subunit [Steroidobacteraceae bacterium]|jgi:glutaconate CoA-transferase subunit B|nr:acyl CoA:acetate/3-ketoacid CoA transferase, beta subunit [Steroidobacteraceae bacterium]